MITTWPRSGPGLLLAGGWSHSWGLGGIGKTVLARAVMEHGERGIAARRAVIELSRIDRPAAVPGAVAAGLGSPTFDVLLSSPPEGTTMMLIDNCEHVTDAAAEAIGRLLDAWSDVRVLATSRSVLGLPGESLVVLAPLAVPASGALDARTGAVLLFCESARDHGVEIEDRDIDAVVELCRRLDPLRRGQGRFVNVGSINAQLPLPFWAVYSASKVALLALSDALRIELAPWNIGATVLTLGTFATDMRSRAQTAWAGDADSRYERARLTSTDSSPCSTAQPATLPSSPTHSLTCSGRHTAGTPPRG